jgi:hypothetical protein
VTRATSVRLHRRSRDDFVVWTQVRLASRAACQRSRILFPPWRRQPATGSLHVRQYRVLDATPKIIMPSEPVALQCLHSWDVIDGDMLRPLEFCPRPPRSSECLLERNAWKSLRRGVLRSDQACSHASARGRGDCLRRQRGWCSIIMRRRLPAAAPAAWTCDPRAFRFWQWPGRRRH